MSGHALLYYGVALAAATTAMRGRNAAVIALLLGAGVVAAARGADFSGTTREAFLGWSLAGAVAGVALGAVFLRVKKPALAVALCLAAGILPALPFWVWHGVRMSTSAYRHLR